MDNEIFKKLNNKGRVLRFERDSDFIAKRADGKRQQNDPVNAAALYWAALERRPDDHDILLALADVLSDMQRFVDSNHLLIPHMHEDEYFMKEAYCRVGFNFFAIGEYDAAHRCFDRFFELTDEVSERTDVIVDALELMDSMEDNEPFIKDAAATILEDRLIEAHELIGKNEFSKAKGIIQELKNEYPEDERVTYDLALACMCEKEYGEGIGHLDELLSKNSDNFQALSLKLIYARNVNDELMMASVCKNLERCEPESPEVLMPILGIILDSGRTELALNLAGRVYRKLPYDCLANHLLALCYIKQGLYKKASALYSKLVSINRNDCIARFYLNKCSEETPVFTHLGMEGMTRYQLPLFDVMENIKRLAHVGSLSADEILEKWRTDASFKELVRWGFTMREFSLSYSLLNMLRLIGDEEAQLIMRETVIDPETNQVLAHEALGMLKSLDAPEPYFTFANGCLLEGRVSMVDLAEWHVPKQYRLIFPRFHSIAADIYDIEVYASASGIMESFLSKHKGVFPPLDEARSIALSAALECAACKNCGVEVKDDILERYGITQRRLTNAIDRMVNMLLLPELHDDEGGDNR